MQKFITYHGYYRGKKLLCDIDAKQLFTKLLLFALEYYTYSTKISTNEKGKGSNEGFDKCFVFLFRNIMSTS